MGFKTTITIKHIDGWSFKLDVDRDADILGIKVMIWDIQKVPLDKQRLVFDGKELNDSTKLIDVGIVEGDTIFLVETKTQPEQVEAVTVEPIQIEPMYIDNIPQSPIKSIQSEREPIDINIPPPNNYEYLETELNEWKIKSVIKLSCWMRIYLWLGLLISLLSTLICLYSIIPFLFYMLGIVGAKKLCKCLLTFPIILTAIIGFGGLALNVMSIYYSGMCHPGSMAISILHIIIFACICKLVCKIQRLTKNECNEARQRIKLQACCC